MAAVQGPTISTILTQVSCGSQGNVWGVDASHNIYHYQSSDGTNWTHAQIPGTLSQVSAAADGTVWGVNAAGLIYRYVGNNTWTLISGKLAHVSVGSASLIWGVDPNGLIYQYTGSAWTQIPGNLKQVSVAADGTVWGVNAAGLIYRYAGNNTWTQILGHGQGANAELANGNGTFTLVSVSMPPASGVFALDASSPDSSLWNYNGGNPSNTWSPFWDSTTITSCSFAADGSWAYIDQGATIYQSYV
ncbi:MAG: tectonin domain-containing protein [Ktedonobacteraceae bacterium]